MSEMQYSDKGRETTNGSSGNPHGEMINLLVDFMEMDRQKTENTK